MIPRRIQRRRSKGWRMPQGCVYVGRPTKWGNPYYVAGHGRQWMVLLSGHALNTVIAQDARLQCVHLAVGWYSELIWHGVGALDLKARVTVDDIRRELRGKDLCCWCREGDPCHADFLLAIAEGVKWWRP